MTDEEFESLIKLRLPERFRQLEERVADLERHRREESVRENIRIQLRANGYRIP